MTTTHESEPMVLAESVCKNFGALRVLKGITLEVGKGQVLVMVGIWSRSTRGGCMSMVI